MASYIAIDLVWLNKASIPSFSFQGGLEVLQIYLPGWGLTLIIRLISVPNLTCTELANWIRAWQYSGPKILVKSFLEVQTSC